MKLTGILKDKVDKANTKEEKKDLIAEAGMEFTDDELDGVAGGSRQHRQIIGKCTNSLCFFWTPGNNEDPLPNDCPVCGAPLKAEIRYLGERKL